jgi:hypothetical protein
LTQVPRTQPCGNGRKSSKNLSGPSCFARDGFYTMALSSGSK